MIALESPRGVRIDLTKPLIKEKPVEKEAKSILFYYGFSLYSTKVTTYKFEYLFAEKIIAFTERGTTRDLYDVWIAKSLDYNKDKLLKHLLIMANKRKTDPRIIITKHHHADIDMKKVDSLVSKLNGEVMYKEVQDFIRLLFFEE